MAFLTQVLLGVVGGAINAALIARRRPSERGGPLAIVLGVAAGIYVGYGLQDGRAGQALVQVLGALPFIVVAASWPQAVGVLGLAWLAHGAWDAVHQLGLLETRVPPWYPGVCLGWDVVLGAAALRWRERGAVE